jgi:hypothetical protein
MSFSFFSELVDVALLAFHTELLSESLHLVSCCSHSKLLYTYYITNYFLLAWPSIRS